MIKKEKIAKILRVVSIPPVVVVFLILILSTFRKDIFRNKLDIFMPILFLGMLPILAYPFQKIIPKYRYLGREFQRKLAFIFASIGYPFALVWSFLSNASHHLVVLCSTYFLSLVFLIFCNKVLRIKASGHSCSIAGPLSMLIYWVDWKVIFLFLIYSVLVFWSSLYLKRHTVKDLIIGVVIGLSSFVISIFGVNFYKGGLN